ncbi:MAG: LuxR C-terminal-related transcriptional regulator [Imperialibacter sp.]|uniref:response regulator transcription factor n=1 Tax=Imperialibacter sp. TaxID=2038411 RepID=UPI0032EE4E43
MDKSQILHQIFQSHDNYLAKESASLQKVPVEELIASFFCPGPFYYYILDSPTLTFEKVSSTLPAILGIDVTGKPISDLVNIVHPDDLDFLLKCEDYVAHFLKNKVAPEKMVNYKISYCFRERVKDGTYKLFNMQTITLATTTDGALLKVMGVHTDISHITSTNNYRLSLIGLNGEPSYLGIDVFERETLALRSAKPVFTKRELEIVRLLGEGLTVKEIASKLFIADTTVSTHKRNVLNKSHCRNTTQLVAYCLKKGLI